MRAMVGSPSGQRQLALVCNAVFLACLLALHLLERDVDPVVASVSYYALTGHGWLMTIGFLALAAGSGLVGRIAWLSGAVGTSRALGVCAAAVLVLTAFPGDPWYPWERWPTLVGGIHAAAACVPIVLLPFVALNSLRVHWRRDADRQIARSAIVYLAASIVVGAYVAGQLATGNTPGIAGLGERVVVVTGVVWLSAVANSGRQARSPN